MQVLAMIEITRIFSAVLSAVLLLGVVSYFRVKRLSVSFPVVFVLLVTSLAFLFLAFFPSLFDRIVPDMRLGRIRGAVVVLTVFIITVTFESIRRTQLKERYALLWIIPCVFILFLTAYPNIMDWLRESFGMEYASIMLAVVFLSVMAAVFVLAKSLSVNERNIVRLAQRCAELEVRLREIEKTRR